MTGRVVAPLLIAAALAAPATAAGYPDWRTPATIGVAQDGVLRFPQAVAYDASGTPDPGPQAPAGPYVYVADQHSFSVQKFTAGGTFVRRFGGYGSGPGRFGATTASASPTTGLLGGIGGVAVDASGQVYVLDSLNSRVERFSPSGEFESQFGTFGTAPGQFNFGINGGLAVLGDELYVGDQDNHRVQRFHLGEDGRPDRPPIVFGARGTAPGQFDIVAGLTVDPARDHAVYVADDRNNRVQRFSAGGAFEALVGTLGSGPGQLDNPYDTGVDRAGRLFVADNQNHRVARFDAASLAFQTSFGGAGPQPGRLNNVRGVAVAPEADAAGGVFATNTSLNQISEFGVDGAFVRSFGADGRGPGAFMQPRDVAVEPNGDIIVADTRADRVAVLRADGRIDTWARISTALGTPTSGGRPGEFRDPTAVAVDPRNGDVWVAEGAAGKGRLVVLAPDGTRVATREGLDRPEGVASDGHGGVLVSETQRDRILSFSLSEGRLVMAGEVGGEARYTRPMGMDIDAGGRLLVADTYSNRVLRFEAPAVSSPGGAGGTVPAALVLSLGTAGSFGAFTPGVARTYTTAVAAEVLSTAGDAALTVSDPSNVAPGRLVNGAFALTQPLLAGGAPLPANVRTWAAPVSHEPVSIEFAQTIGATEPLRTGSYAKTLTFTLSTTQP
jgi:tripartite motif-containing protein 71